MKVLSSVIAVILVFTSCALFIKPHNADAVYILDWMSEAVYTLDKDLNVSQTPFCASGTAPSFIKADEEGIYISNSGFGGQPSVMRYDSTGTLIAQYNAPDNSSPSGIETDEQYVYVGLWGSSSVAVLDKHDLTLQRTIEHVNSPWQIRILGGKLYVGTSDWNGFNYLYVIDSDDWSLDSIEAGLNPAYISVYNNNVYVACTGNSFNGINGSVVMIQNGAFSDSICLGSCPSTLYATEAGLLVSNGYTNNFDEYVSNVLVMDNELNLTDTLLLTQVSCFSRLDNTILAGSNAGEIYVVDIETLTETDSLALSTGIFAADMSAY